MVTEQVWPSGAVTFLFSDIVDSTPLWDRHRADMRRALAEHDALLRTAVESNGGVVVKSTGDGIHAVFSSPLESLLAAIAAQRALQDAQWPAITPDRIRVRMGLHTGEAELRAGDYFGAAVNRAARLMSIGHGGQILLSGTTAALIRDELPNDVTLLDLGEHQLKGLSRSAHVFQAKTYTLPYDFPPLRTGETTKGNLPRPLSNFIGREEALADIERLLAETRLLTLLGPGGTGKTRLSLEAGRMVEGRYDQGVWLVELAPLTDGELIAPTVAALFDIHEQPGIPIMDTLAAYMRSKQLLLILDNCEHLITASARLAADLLTAAPELTILASSREGLGVAGETTVHIPAMRVPMQDIVARDQVARFEAVRLFLARARAAKPGFELTEANAQAVGQIVRRLDGIPLAIELAAARVKLLSPDQIAARLDDRFRLLTGGSRTALPRQQTLRALIDWSYDLLDEAERWFFRQMSVFSGGWTLEAAEYVVESAIEIGPEAEEKMPGEAYPTGRYLDALDLLANLVNKSLVRIDDSRDESRYFYLETIRQYARNRLFEAGEGARARDIHYSYFSQMADTDFDGSLMIGGARVDDAARYNQLESDLENLRAALDWGSASDPIATIDLLRYLSWFWTMRGLGVDLQQRALLLLDAVSALPPGDEEEMKRRRRARAFALSIFAMGSGTSGGSEEAYEATLEAETIYRDDGSLPGSLADVLFWRAIIGIEVGRPDDYDAARETYDIGEQLGDVVLQQIGLIAMARWALVQGDITTATAHLAEARQSQVRHPIPILITYQAFAESMAARASGDFSAARRILADGAEALRRAHHRLFATVIDSEIGHTLRLTGDLASALEIYRAVIVEWRELGHLAAVANQLESFAFIALAEDRLVRAARLLGAAQALRETLSSSMTPEEQRDYDEQVVALEAALDRDTLREAWEAGRALDIDAAVEYAIAT
ncbi:MAG: ATP-binding protein [Candidatus Promineifilaceae bacterium]